MNSIPRSSRSGNSGKSHPFESSQLLKARETELKNSNPQFVADTYKHLARNGNAEAQYRYAKTLLNTTEAIAFLKDAAAKGHVMAQCELGELYANGDGVQKDDKKAVEYFTLAAEEALPRARLNLGVMHCTGRGTEKNLALGKQLLKQVEDQYLNNAKELGHDYGDAAFYVENKPTKALPTALYLLSKIYNESDKEKAKAYFTEAIKADHPFAKFLSVSSKSPTAVPPQYLAMLEQAGNRGCLATFTLLLQIIKGDSVTLTKANSSVIPYCQLAADAGNANAAFHVGKYYFDMNNVDAAKTYLQKAANDVEFSQEDRGIAAWMLFQIEDQRFWSYIDSSMALAYLKQSAALENANALAHPKIINEKNAALEKAKALQAQCFDRSI